MTDPIPDAFFRVCGGGPREATKVDEVDMVGLCDKTSIFGS